MKTILYMTCLFVFTSYASALECYTCSDCWSSTWGQLAFLDGTDTCPDQLLGLDPASCYKSVDNGAIGRGCTTQAQCLILELARCDINPDACVTCCGESKCNAGTTMSYSAAMCFAGVVMYLLFNTF